MNRQISRLVAFENATGVDAGLMIHAQKVSPIAHQTAGRGKLGVGSNRGHSVAECQRAELFASADKERIGARRLMAILPSQNARIS
jgi:hypothetical protein